MSDSPDPKNFDPGLKSLRRARQASVVSGSPRSMRSNSNSPHRAAGLNHLERNEEIARKNYLNSMNNDDQQKLMGYAMKYGRQ